MARKNVNADILDYLYLYNEAIVMENNSFTADDKTPIKVRSIGSVFDNFEVNDIIRIPKDYQVVSVKKSDQNYLCIVVEVESENGTIRKIPFIPNCLAKSIIPINENGNRLGKVKTSGTVAEWYATQGTVDHAMEELAGNEIIVMDKEYYSVRDVQARDITSAAIYSYEWKCNTRRTTKENIENQIRSMIDHLLNERLPKQTSKYIKEGDECIIRFKFTGYYGDEIFLKQDYTLNNIKVQLPLDFNKNMESWVSYIYKRRIYYVQTIDFEYKLDFYNCSGKHTLGITENYVNGDAFDNWT